MNLYLVSRKDEWNYDDFDAFIVASENCDKARLYHPNGELATFDLDYREKGYNLDTWTINIGNVDVEEVGTTHLPEGTIVLSSFNAG